MQLAHLLVGEVLRKAVRQLQAGDAQQRLGDRDALALQELQEGAQQVDLGVDAGDGIPTRQGLADVVEDVLALELGQALHAAFQAKVAPEQGMFLPKTAQIEVEAGAAPVFLLDALVALQFTHQPGR